MHHLLQPAPPGKPAFQPYWGKPAVRFVRWRRAGVWGRIMDALAAAHDAAVQMIDTSIVRVHQHAACMLETEDNRSVGHEAD
jgi:transposase